MRSMRSFRHKNEKHISKKSEKKRRIQSENSSRYQSKKSAEIKLWVKIERLTEELNREKRISLNKSKEIENLTRRLPSEDWIKVQQLTKALKIEKRKSEHKNWEIERLTSVIDKQKSYFISKTNSWRHQVKKLVDEDRHAKK